MPRLSRFAYKPSYQRSPCNIFIHNPVSLHSSPLFLSEPLLTKPSNTAGLTIAFPFSCKHLSIANHSFRSSPQIYPACTIFLSLVPQIHFDQRTPSIKCSRPLLASSHSSCSLWFLFLFSPAHNPISSGSPKLVHYSMTMYFIKYPG